MARAGRGYPIQPRRISPVNTPIVIAAAALTLTATATPTLVFPATASATLSLTAAATVPVTASASIGLTLTATPTLKFTATASASLSLVATAAVSPVSFVKRIGTATASTTNNTLTITVPSTVTAGHSLIVSAGAALTDSCTVTDTAGNTYTQDATGTGAGGNVGVRVFSVHNCLGLTAGQTITVTWSSTHAFLEAIADEFAGLAQTGVVDTTASDAGSSTTALTAGTLTTTGSAGDLIYSAFGTQVVTNTTTYSPTGGASSSGAVAHAFAGSNGRDLFATYKIGVAGVSSPTATGSIAHPFGSVQVAYFPLYVTASPTLELTATATPTLVFPATASAAIGLTLTTNAYPSSAALSLDLFAAATPTTGFAARAALGLSLALTATPTQIHIPVETDLTFRVSTDDLIIDAAVTSVDMVTSISGPGGDTRHIGTDTTVTADLTDASQLAGYNAGKAKAQHLYRLRSKPRKNAPTLTVNAAPFAPEIHGDGTIGPGQWVLSATESPTAYQAAVALEVSDLLLLSIIPPGGGDPLIARYWVEGIRHVITADGTWQVTLNISRADENPTGGWFQLGASAFGDGSALTW